MTTQTQFGSAEAPARYKSHVKEALREIEEAQDEQLTFREASDNLQNAHASASAALGVLKANYDRDDLANYTEIHTVLRNVVEPLQSAVGLARDQHYLEENTDGVEEYEIHESDGVREIAVRLQRLRYAVEDDKDPTA